ncbi:UNKNOWN [Stylonychia lemnae]|uniref:Uncharacterized protein n=1 Tax=Stylonychia lemnae TaxID=5949 RepID=A0A078A8C6_STYLE|nr:UNKNOWN [Stylonychia lemnae]|eukprot:CDW77031.1 UNKNOWN [Stylonychia lemnae]
MTSQQSKQAKQTEHLQKFKRDLKNMKADHKDKSEIIDFIKDSLDKQCESSADLAKSKMDVEAVEGYYHCLAMIRTILECQVFNFEQDHDDIQFILHMYDVPCTIEMSRILLRSKEYDQVNQLLRRAQQVDPKNQEALKLRDQLEIAQNKQDDWKKLQESHNMDQFVKEYVEEKESEEQQEEQSDPARALPQMLEILIRVVLVIPYAAFLKVLEPLLRNLYESHLVKGYNFVTEQYPRSTILFRLVFGSISRVNSWLISRIDKCSHKKENDTKQQDTHYQLSDKVGDDIKRLKDIVQAIVMEKIEKKKSD